MFITGFTGLVDKIIVEKLVYSVPDIGTIYMLIRTKKDVNPQQTLETIIRGANFDRIRKKRADWQQYLLSKLVPIAGEIGKENLGMSEQDIQLVSSTTHIYLHSAATVNFNEPLEVACNLNTLGYTLCVSFDQRKVQI